MIGKTNPRLWSRGFRAPRRTARWKGARLFRERPTAAEGRDIMREGRGPLDPERRAWRHTAIVVTPCYTSTCRTPRRHRPPESRMTLSHRTASIPLCVLLAALTTAGINGPATLLAAAPSAAPAAPTTRPAT